MSANDPKRTFRRRLLGHIVGPTEGRRRNGKTERLSGPDIEYQFKRDQPQNSRLHQRRAPSLQFSWVTTTYGFPTRRRAATVSIVPRFHPGSVNLEQQGRGAECRERSIL